MPSEITGYPDKQKAIDSAVWLNFKNRNSTRRFGVIAGAEDDWYVLDEEKSDEMEMPFLDILPDSYKDMTYEQIEKICSDAAPLLLWAELVGRFQTMDGDLLKFILHFKIPFERFIRYELASRGFDQNNQWVGFERAREIWLR